jgi:hypothetical protein
MFVTAKTTIGLKDYLESNLNTKITAVGTEIGESIDQVKDWKVGYRDPYGLARYNAVLVVPDRRQKSGQASIACTYNVICAIAGSNNDEIALAQEAYYDAVYNLIEDDVTLGDLCLEAAIDDYLPYAPVQGTNSVGVDLIVMRVEIDRLLV